MKSLRTRTTLGILLVALLALLACAPAAQPAAAPAAPAAPAVAPKAPAQPQAPAPAAAAAAPRAPSAPAPVAAPAPAAPKGPQRGGILNVFFTAEVPRLDPILLTTASLAYRIGGVYTRLIRHKTGPEVQPGEIILLPDLAESWEVSPDGLTFTFHLRKGVKWQNLPPVNGREFVADDVIWSYNRIKTPGSVYASWFRQTEKLEALDRYTVRITNKEPIATFLLRISDPYAMIMPREVAEADGDLKKRAIGTGPFILTERVENVITKLRRNPNYWEAGIPYLDGYDVYVILEQSAALAAFRAGKLDIVGASSKQERESVLKSRPDAQVIQTTGLGWSKFIFRTDKEPWNNQKLRQAISVAMDRQGELDTRFNGEGRMQGPIPPYPGWALPVEKLGEASKYYKYDLNYAKQLLAEAGYPNGIGDLLFTTPPNASWTDRIYYYNGNWLKAGIKFKIQVMEYAEFLTKPYVAKYEGASYIPGGPGAADPGEYLQLLWHPSSELYNTSHVNDPFVTKIIDEQSRILDETKRKKMIQDLQLYLAEKMYYVPLPGPLGYTLVNARVRGYMPTTTQNGGDVWRYVWIEGAK